MFFSLTFYAPVHELGHWLAAQVYGVKVLDMGYSYVTTHEVFFSSGASLIMFKAAGLLITFYPALFAFAYLWRRGSTLWQLPYTWVLVAPIASRQDFIDIGMILGNLMFGEGLQFIASTAAVMLLVTYFYEVLTRELVISSSLLNR